MTATLCEEQRVHIIQGEYFVSNDPNIVITTILGSCVAACVRDPLAGVGGINHFLLPGKDPTAGGVTDERVARAFDGIARQRFIESRSFTRSA